MAKIKIGQPTPYEQANSQLDALAVKAAEVLAELLESGDPAIKLKAAALCVPAGWGAGRERRGRVTSGNLAKPSIWAAFGLTLGLKWATIRLRYRLIIYRNRTVTGGTR